MSFGNPQLCCWFICVLHVLFVILLQIHVQLKQGFNTIITTYIISSNMNFYKYKKWLILERKQIKANKEALLNQDPDELGQRNIDKSHVCESICSNYEKKINKK